MLNSIRICRQLNFEPPELKTIMSGGILDEKLVDELEILKLNSYNINKEKDIGALRIRLDIKKDKLFQN